MFKKLRNKKYFQILEIIDDEIRLYDDLISYYDDIAKSSSDDMIKFINIDKSNKSLSIKAKLTLLRDRIIREVGPD